MTKADIVNKISGKTGIEKLAVQTTVEEFMKTVRKSLEDGQNVYLRGFGSFVVKKRAQKNWAKHIKEYNYYYSSTQYSIF